MIVESDELKHRNGRIHVILVYLSFLENVKALALVSDGLDLIENIPQLGIFFIYPLIEKVLLRFLRLRVPLLTLSHII